MTRVVISSGHGKYVSGAVGYIDEHNEAVRVVDRVAELLGSFLVAKYHDNVSHSQNENLNRIVDFHNSKSRDLDVSVHFNSYQTTTKPMGTECLYVTQETLSRNVATGLSGALELPNRGPKKRTDLFFLNNTEMPAILIEVCFVDSSADVEAYELNFEQACIAIAETISGHGVSPGPEPEPEPPEEGALFYARGRCSYFGGPDDSGVSSSEGLAFIYSYTEAPHLFLPNQPEGTTGLARRLNPDIFYVACRWNYDITSKDMLKRPSYQALVSANGREFLAWPADWGPHEDTGRVADLSPGLMEALGIETDDPVEVEYPAP